MKTTAFRQRSGETSVPVKKQDLIIGPVNASRCKKIASLNEAGHTNKKTPLRHQTLMELKASLKVKTKNQVVLNNQDKQARPYGGTKTEATAVI